MKKIFKKAVSILLAVVILAGAGIYGVKDFSTDASAASATGVGLSEFALQAYYEDWSYVYGAMSYGAVDCSGLIMLYNGVGGSRTSMCQVASEKGYMGSLPRIHGLGLWQPGHVGVYVGSGMAVDARDESSGVCYQSVYTKNWQMWFKVVGVSYPTTGWVNFNGNSFYYEDGEYLVNAERTIDGVTYTFGSAGTVVSASDGSDVGSISGNNSAYDNASSSTPSYSGGSSSSGSTYDAAAEAAAEEQRQKEEEEERKRQEEEEAERERQAAIQRLADAKEQSAKSYLTAMTLEDSYSNVEPETVAITAPEDAKDLKDTEAVNENETPATAAAAGLVGVQTTVTLPKSMDSGNNEVSTASANQSHPGMFFIIILAVFASSLLFFFFIKKNRLEKRAYYKKY